MKKGLMQTDPMTGMPVAQPGSTPMFPVSQGVNGGSMARFNPTINQYAQANPLANAAYASQPMPALAQQKRMMKMEKAPAPPRRYMEMVSEPLPPKKQIKKGVLDPTMSMTMVVDPLRPDTGQKEIKPLPPTMHMHKEIKPLNPVQDTLTYKHMAVGRKALNQEKNVPSNTLKEIGEKVGQFVMSAPASLVPAAHAASLILKAKDRVFGSERKAKESGKNYATEKANELTGN